MTDECSVIIGADFFPTKNNSACFTAGDVDTLFGYDLLKILEKCDCRIFNLEGPLTDNLTPILKDGPVLRADRSTVNGYTAINTDLLLLSNNHILDHGADGCVSTMDVLDQNNISWIGIGQNSNQRSKAFYFHVGSLTIGVYNCCEHEYSVVDDGEWGANEYNPLRTYDDIVSAKKTCDFLIVAYHGGKEKTRYPAPYLVDIFRKMSDCGADIVIAQHTHCIGCYEDYKDSLLLYGQGNFLFGSSYNEYYQNGLLLKLVFYKGEFEYEFIPVVKNGDYTRLANETEKSKIISDLEERSKSIKNRSFLINEHKQRADVFLADYLSSLHGYSLHERIFKKLWRSGYEKYILKRYKNRDIVYLYNYLRCEAHRDLLLQGLKDKLEENQNEN